MADVNPPANPPKPITLLWLSVGIVAIFLTGLSIVILVRMDIFSSEDLTDQQLDSLWAFLGVSLGAVATMIGALLTEQHNRRTMAITAEVARQDKLAKDQQVALAREAESRLTLDTIAKVLELITVEGKYAPKARVAGAVATMMELRGDVVAIRILRSLWAENALDTNTAVWLIGHVLQNKEAKDEELIEASALLSLNAAKLVPAESDENQGWVEWPAVLRDSWPSTLPSMAKQNLVAMAVKTLLAREFNYWTDRGDKPAIRLLHDAMDDAEVRSIVAKVLVTMFDVLDAKRFAALGLAVDVSTREELRSNATHELAPWFERLLSRFEPWAHASATA